MEEEARDDLLRLLARHLVAGPLDRTRAREALRAALGDATEPPRLLELADALDGAEAPALSTLKRDAERELLALARQLHVLRRERRSPSEALEREFEGFPSYPAAHAGRELDHLEELLRLRRDLAFLRGHADDVPELHALVSGRFADALDEARESSLIRHLVSPSLPDEPPPLPPVEDREARERALLAALAEPPSRVAAVVERLSGKPWEWRLAAVGLALRFGAEGATPHDVVTAWRAGSAARGSAYERAAALRRRFPDELAALRAELDPSAPADERRRRAEAIPAPAADWLLDRWSIHLTARQRRALRGEDVAEPLTPPPAGVPGDRTGSRTRAAAPAPPSPDRPAPTPARSPRKTPPPRAAPALWSEHLRPFLLENWYVAIGAIMVVVGSSLLAWFTWDRHWAFRYTLLPALLGGFTFTLAWLGSWLERRDPTLRGTSAVLRGAAVGLLPINFMTVALLAGDPRIRHPLPVVLGVAALYLAVFGAGLRRWCAGVHAALGGVLGGTLLALCALVLLRPVASTLEAGPAAVRALLGGGFYAGFLVAAAAVVVFTRRILTPSMARASRVPWFFGATLLLTFVQVFVWVHALAGHLPHVATYAPMVIGAGALLLHVERRVLDLAGDERRLEPASFLGFALVLLGLVMAQADPWVRAGAFLLAGAAWLGQATPRRHPLHAWAGLTLLALGGASLALVPGFPPTARPWLGLALALAAGFGARVARRRDHGTVAAAAYELQVVALVLTALVAMLGQWQHRSEPLHTAAVLLVVAGALAWRGHRDRRQRWTLTSAVVLAATLPYLGCVDLTGRTLHGNTMVFGLAVLSLLWIALDFVAPTRETRRARSTVLWFYGALAVVAMTLRVLVEQRTPGDLLWHRALMDHAGPVLAAVALGFATHWSRSLVPAGMAAIILVILFPELRSQYHETFDALGWGTGLGSAVAALALVAACFVLRRLPALRALGQGDRFLGRTPFPLQRRDWTLFTWPVAASALYLLARNATFTLAANLTAGMTAKAAVAQLLGGAGWFALAAYGRRRTAARHAVALGFGQLFVGTALAYDVATERFFPAAPLVLYGLLVQALALAARRAAATRLPWMEPLLARPARTILRHGTIAIGVLALAALLLGAPAAWTWALVAFLAAQCAVRGPADAERPAYRFGGLLVLLAWVAAFRAAGAADAGLLHPSNIAHLKLVTAMLLVAVQVGHAFVEMRTRLAHRIRALLVPFQAWAVAAAALLGFALLRDAVAAPAFDAATAALALLGVLATARANRSGVLAALGALLAYVLACAPALAGAADPAARLAVLVQPWRLATFGLAAAAALLAGRRLHAPAPRLLESARALRVDPLPAPLPLLLVAGTASASAAFAHTVVPEWREAAAQLPAPYLGALAFAVLAGAVRAPAFLYATAALLAAGNVHAVRVLAGPLLEARGVTPVQLVALGFVATVGAGVLARRVTRRGGVLEVADRTVAAGAALVLLLLAAQYVARPDVTALTSPRLLASGALAYLASLGLRALARRPRGPEPTPVELAESGYHLGLTIALWCVALLVPAFRRPGAALVALSVPFAYFLARAEVADRHGAAAAARFRRTATVLGFGLLALYLLRGVFQVVLFPGTPVLTDHYHVNAPLVMLLGLGLVRLHALGGGFWVAFYGGLALMAGSFFAVTAAPGLSPFDGAVAAGWAALALGHFWTAASAQRSPLRAGLQRLGGLDEDTWHTLRRGWGVVLLAATQVPPLHAALASGATTQTIAPLLAGAASVVVHHGVLRRRPIYLAVAGLELLVALHLDFLVPSPVPWQAVVWVLLGLWTAMLFAADRVPGLTRDAVATASLAAAGLVLAHVLVHRPSTPEGLTAFAAGVALLLAAPAPRASGGGMLALALLAPAWFGYFAALPDPPAAGDALAAWPVLAGAAALLLAGVAAAAVERRGLALAAPAAPRLLHRLVDRARRDGRRAGSVALYAAFAATAAVFLLHADRPLGNRTLVLQCGLFAACAWGFSVEGRERRAMAPYFLLQVAAVGVLATLRRQLVLTTGAWIPQYDVWLACGGTLLLTGAKEAFDLRPRERAVPVATSLFVLPVVALAWTVGRGLGTDVALLVVGLHSVVYAFLGRDDRESPYHLVAVAGFVAFVVLVLVDRLELRSLQAYTVPAGLGVLVLTQLFRARMTADARNRVRLAAVAAMIGSSAYEALLDPRYAVGFHVALILLGVLAMGLGGFLRVRVYLLAGAAGVLTALASIVYRGLAGLERAARMSAVGVLVLLLGALLVAGAIYYKTHRAAINARLDELRRRFGEWE